MLYKQKKSQAAKAAAGNRLLVSITVLGSAGPIRFVVSEDEVVSAVIETALKAYAREGRLPVLGSNPDDFVLHCPFAGSEALSPWETIGSFGGRNFMLCKKPRMETTAIDDKQTIVRKGSGGWKEWFNKSLNLKISTN
ncbi:hypothetical protein NMG60_11018794 [Bertholletia excelsa]